MSKDICKKCIRKKHCDKGEILIPAFAIKFDKDRNVISCEYFLKKKKVR